ncbi:Terminal nucleotidyltransferase 4B [Halotydeus destructor]|nr:Terminal nucleotidyltransferase 4B [Halotydeus destructor]
MLRTIATSEPNILPLRQDQGDTPHGDYPWRVPHYPYKPGVLGLHEEISHFYEYIGPKPVDLQARSKVVKRLAALIRHEKRPGWANAALNIFGSTATEFCIPTSDIDVSVTGLPESTHTLQEIYEVMSRSEMYCDISLIESATVPIIKAMEIDTGFKLDIATNPRNGGKAISLLQRYVREFPNLRQLVLVVKQFLYMRNLHEVFKGGISSYAVQLMMVSFLQLHPREDAVSPRANLGVLLIEFFELYGCLFNYQNVGIIVKNGGCYVRKAALSDKLSVDYLCIQDPLEDTNLIGKGSYGILAVQRAFRQAYLDLAVACGPSATFVDPYSSILGRIIKFAPERQRKRSEQAQ